MQWHRRRQTLFPASVTSMASDTHLDVGHDSRNPSADGAGNRSSSSSASMEAHEAGADTMTPPPAVATSVVVAEAGGLSASSGPSSLPASEETAAATSEPVSQSGKSVSSGLGPSSPPVAKIAAVPAD
eukprot:902897-Karenia_brevis.AAC.1